MDIKETPVSRIRPYPNNPRDNSEAVGKVADSIKAYGFEQPIVVDKDGVIIIGHTRLAAAKKLGLKTVPVVWATQLSDQQAKGLRIADNKTADYSIWDNKKLIEELDQINKDIYTGFKESGIFDDVLNEADNSPIVENKKGVTYSMKISTQNEEAYKKIKDYVDEVLALEP